MDCHTAVRVFNKYMCAISPPMGNVTAEKFWRVGEDVQSNGVFFRISDVMTSKEKFMGRPRCARNSVWTYAHMGAIIRTKLQY
jgi:hypothetical protein